MPIVTPLWQWNFRSGRDHMNADTAMLDYKPFDPTGRAPSSPLLQRKCDCGQHTVGGGQCDDCGKKKMMLERSTRDSAVSSESSGGVPSIVQEALGSPGQPLDAATRSFME